MPTKLIPSYKTTFGISEPGDFAFSGWDETEQGPTHLSFVNPVCKFKYCTIDITKGEQNRPKFHWDGNLTCPSITPSIGCDHRCGWHGHITNGEILP